MRFVDLFAGLGGFHIALRRLGFECVYACEIDPELRALYQRNFDADPGAIGGDIRLVKSLVPDHDILCAGFPCQPFSKSGGQLGIRDVTRGTLFHEILDILESKRPQFVLLENVGNFGRHDGGRTWAIVRERLEELGYHVRGTEHKTPRPRRDWRDIGAPSSRNNECLPASRTGASTGCGLLSPHQFGFPQHRERFYIIGSLSPISDPAFPLPDAEGKASLFEILQETRELPLEERLATSLSPQQRDCINHWNALVKALPSDVALPSFPLWGDELDARYPFEHSTPWASTTAELRKLFPGSSSRGITREHLLARLPSYARDKTNDFRQWKKRYIRQNREWWGSVRDFLPPSWHLELQRFPPSQRKLEWNAKGGERELWEYILQFRPSGLRVKRASSSPALVAMTSTQIPIVGPHRRFLTKIEGLRLQDLPDTLCLPTARDKAFRALGNAVHAGVVERIAHHLVSPSVETNRRLAGRSTSSPQAALCKRKAPNGEHRPYR